MRYDKTKAAGTFLLSLVLAVIAGLVCWGCGNPAADDPPAEPGESSLIINFEAPEDEQLDLSMDPGSDLSRSAGTTARITAGGEPVRWFIDGGERPETGASIEIAARDYPVGKHYLSAVVRKNGIPYSKELVFKVVE